MRRERAPSRNGSSSEKTTGGSLSLFYQPAVHNVDIGQERVYKTTDCQDGWVMGYIHPLSSRYVMCIL